MDGLILPLVRHEKEGVAHLLAPPCLIALRRRRCQLRLQSIELLLVILLESLHSRRRLPRASAQGCRRREPRLELALPLEQLLPFTREVHMRRLELRLELLDT